MVTTSAAFVGLDKVFFGFSFEDIAVDKPSGDSEILPFFFFGIPLLRNADIRFNYFQKCYVVY